TSRAGPVTTTPSRRTEPEVGAMSPVTMRSSVVLPHPDGPTTQTNCPRGTLNDICSMIRRPPRSRSTRSKVTADSAGCGFPRTLSGRNGCTPRPLRKDEVLCRHLGFQHLLLVHGVD